MRIIYLTGLLVICIMIIHTMYAYSQSTWAHVYRASDYAEAYSIGQTIDGGYIVAGDAKGLSNISAQDMWIIKLNSSGNIIWQKTYGGSYDDYATSIQETSDGGFIAAGITRPFFGSEENLWVLKLDSNGAIIWQKMYGGMYDDYAASIQQTSDGGYIISGNTYFIGSKGDIRVLKLDSNGAIVWQKAYSSLYDDYANSIQQTSDGGFIVTGYTDSFGAGSWDFLVLKLDSNGAIVWQKTYGGIDNDYAKSIQQTSDGGYIIAGETYSFGAGYGDLWVIKVDSNGAIVWQKTYGGIDNDYAKSIQQTTDGGYIVAGETSSFDAGNSDMLVLKLDANGAIIWQKMYGGIRQDRANSIRQTSDGGYIVTGVTYSFGDFYGDIWVLKLDANGDMGITCNLIKNASMCSAATSIIAFESYASINITSIVPSDTNATVQSTAASTIEQCDGNNIDLQLYLGTKPEIDDSGGSTPNGIIEPDEPISLRGRLENLGAIDALNTTGILSTSDPINITQPNSFYGNILSNRNKLCTTCYELTAPLSNRNLTHWDFVVTDRVSANGYGPVYFYYTYHVGNSFSDVPSSYIFYSYIEKLLHSEITSGCTISTYCPDDNAQRQQMAKFVCTSMESANPCSCTLSSCSGIFADVASSNIFCSYIEALYNNGIVAGCQASPLKYCPNDSTQRQAMAKIVCLGMESSIPGFCIASGCSGIFTDVPSSNLFCPYIEALYNTNAISGCGANLFCPDSLVNRGQMAKFLVNGFGFKL